MKFQKFELNNPLWTLLKIVKKMKIRGHATLLLMIIFWPHAQFAWVNNGND